MREVVVVSGVRTAIGTFGGSLKDVQELLGHKSMTMTLRYAHLTQESKRKAVNLLNGLTGQCHKTVTSTPPAVSNLPN